MATTAEQKENLNILLNKWNQLDTSGYRDVQSTLNELGHKSGKVDGDPGRRTRGAACRYLEDNPAILLNNPNPQLMTFLNRDPTVKRAIDKTIDLAKNAEDLRTQLLDLKQRAQNTADYKSSGETQIRADQELLTRVGLNPPANQDGLYGTTTQGAIDNIDSVVARLDGYLKQDFSQAPTRITPQPTSSTNNDKPAVATGIGESEQSPPPNALPATATVARPAGATADFTSAAHGKGIAVFTIRNPEQDGDLTNAQNFAQSAAKQFAERDGIAVLHYPEQNDRITILGLERNPRTLEGDDARGWLERNKEIANRETKLANFFIQPTAQRDGIVAQRGYRKTRSGSQVPTHGSTNLLKEIQKSFNTGDDVSFQADKRWRFLTDNQNRGPTLSLHISDKLSPSQIQSAANAFTQGTSASPYFRGKLTDTPLDPATTRPTQSFTSAATLPDFGNRPVVILNARTSKGRQGHGLSLAEKTAAELQQKGTIAILRDFKSGKYNVYYPGNDGPKTLNATDGNNWYKNQVKGNADLDPKKIVELDILPTASRKYSRGVALREGRIKNDPPPAFKEKVKTTTRAIPGNRDLKKQLRNHLGQNDVKATNASRYIVSKDTDHARMALYVHDRIAGEDLDKAAQAVADGIGSTKNFNAALEIPPEVGNNPVALLIPESSTTRLQHLNMTLSEVAHINARHIGNELLKQGVTVVTYDPTNKTYTIQKPGEEPSEPLSKKDGEVWINANIKNNPNGNAVRVPISTGRSAAISTVTVSQNSNIAVSFSGIDPKQARQFEGYYEQNRQGDGHFTQGSIRIGESSQHKPQEIAVKLAFDTTPYNAGIVAQSILNTNVLSGTTHQQEIFPDRKQITPSGSISSGISLVREAKKFGPVGHGQDGPSMGDLKRYVAAGGKIKDLYTKNGEYKPDEYWCKTFNDCEAKPFSPEGP